MKTPKFYRTAVSDQDKLTRARKDRDLALKRASRAMVRLEMFSALVAKYEKALGDVLPPGPTPKSKKRSHFLDHLTPTPKET